MKTTLFVLISVLIFACKPKNENLTYSTVIPEEIFLDSLSLEKIFVNSTLLLIRASEVIKLSETLVDTSMFFMLKDGFVKIDSLKKSGGYDQYVSKLDIGMYKDINAKVYKKINLDGGKYLKIWGFDYCTYEACPFNNGKVLFVSSFSKDKNIGCIPLAYFQNSSDAPFYESLKTISKMTKDGNVTIEEFSRDGGIDEKDQEYENKGSNKYQFKLTNGVFK